MRQFQAKDIDVVHFYENPEADKAIINKLADQCYLPANENIISAILACDGKFKVSYSISGTLMELLLRFRPDVVDSFKEIIATGCAEILAETYYHSLSYLYSKKEFARQIEKHSLLIRDIFGVMPGILRNTELIYDNKLPEYISLLGLKGVLCEGVSEILKGRSPNHIYSNPVNESIKLLLRNHSLSDDIAFRFDDPEWNEYPLTAEKYASWIAAHGAETDVINLLMDYETFGIQKKKDTGIFDFIRELPGEILKNSNINFGLPSEVIMTKKPVDVFDVPRTISWQNNSGIPDPWSTNMMQNNTLKKIYSLEKMVLKSKNEEAIDTWGKLQASDYFHCMMEEDSKAQAYRYITQFHSPKELYDYLTNMVVDFEINLIRKTIARCEKKFSPGYWNLLSNKN